MSRSSDHLSAAGRIFSHVTGQAHSFLLALSFLTRLAPAMRASPEAMHRAVFSYPLVGAALGAVLLLPFWCGLFSGYPMVRGFVYALLSVWLTRALHLDGLADVLDALGSGKRGFDFLTVLKDSRIGAFGAAGICLVLAGQIVLAGALFAEDRLAPLFLAPICGRSLPIVLACLAPANPRANLGALLAHAPKLRSLFLALGLSFCIGFFCLSPGEIGATVFLCICCMLFLIRLAWREQGYSGDFFGFAIVAGELCALSGALI